MACVRCSTLPGMTSFWFSAILMVEIINDHLSLLSVLPLQRARRYDGHKEEEKQNSSALEVERKRGNRQHFVK